LKRKVFKCFPKTYFDRSFHSGKNAILNNHKEETQFFGKREKEIKREGECE